MAGNTVTVTLEGKGSNLQSALDRARGGFQHLERAAHSASGVVSRALSTAYGVVIGNTVSKAFSSLESAAESFASKVVSATVEAADAQRFLRSAIEETHGSLGKATADAEALGKALGISQSAADRLFATAKVGLSGTGFDATKFLRATADLAAARGIAATELDTIITQIFNGADEGLGKLFAGKNPSTFFNEWARAAGRTAESLTDVERRTILVNAVIQAGARHTGLATERLGSLGGKLDQVAATITDVAAKVGDALSRNVGILKLLDGASTVLGKLATDQGAVDALLQKIANGFVFAANKALDFGQMAAHGINDFVGAIKRAQVTVQILALELITTIEHAWQNLQLDIIKGLGIIFSFEKLIVTGISDVLGKVLDDVVSKAVAGLEKIPESARNALGINTGLDALKGIQGGLESAKRGSDAIAGVFDDANKGLAMWKQQVEDSRGATNFLEGDIAGLAKQYAEIDKATAAANKTTDAFFDSFRPALDDFAKFNAPAGAPDVITTKLIEEGDSLTGFPVAVAANVAAAQEQTKAANSLTTTTGSVLDAVRELGGGIGPLEGALTGLKQAIDKGALIKVIAGSGLSIDELVPTGHTP